jgi:hypothetical protein
MAERDEPTGALVRPYAVTRGRTRPRVDIAIEALIETTVRGRTAHSRPGSGQGQEQQQIATMCESRVQSLAEISARLRMHLGVTRILVGDLRAAGHLDVHVLENDFPDPETIMRVIRGLRSIS